MIKKKRTNKKGNWFVENLGQIVLTAIGIGIGIYFLWAYVLHSGGDSVNALQKCGSLTGNKGECKEGCDKSIELELPNVGCKGVADKCCILKDDNMNDVILPSAFGNRNDKYDFSIQSITIEGGEPSILAAGCKADTRSLNSIKCPAGNGVTIPINIKTLNIAKETVVVKADPVVVINDNGDTVREHRYTGKSFDIKANTAEGLFADIVVLSNEAKPNTYWEIYPYALCDTILCKDIDTANKGIYRKDSTNSMSLKIKFVDPSQI